jgi:putative transcription antitermination factor YqgF
MNDKKNYLGIDWGATNIGVALAHAETGVALPYTTLPNDKNIKVALEKIIAIEDVGVIVIGVPVYTHRENEEYPSETFGKLLAKHLSVRVEYQNEMFTTKMAEANLVERGEKGVSKHNDEEAARIILEGWLATHKTV